MGKRKFEAVLSEALRHLDEGASVDACLARHPEYAAALYPYLELHSSLLAAPKARPTSEGYRAGQARLFAALAEANEEDSKPMIPALSSLAAKALAALATIALLGSGTVGVSAALGGPDMSSHITNLPSHVVNLVKGSDNDDAAVSGNDSDNSGGFSQNGTAGLKGLCNAMTRGSDKGQEEKANATAFKELDAAACASATASPTPTGTATAESHGQGKPEGAGTPSSNAADRAENATQGMGNAVSPNGNGSDHANSRAALGNATTASSPSATPTPSTNSVDQAANAGQGMTNAAGASATGASHADPRSALGDSNSGQ